MYGNDMLMLHCVIMSISQSVDGDLSLFEFVQFEWNKL